MSTWTFEYAGSPVLKGLTDMERDLLLTRIDEATRTGSTWIDSLPSNRNPEPLRFRLSAGIGLLFRPDTAAAAFNFDSV